MHTQVIRRAFVQAREHWHIFHMKFNAYLSTVLISTSFLVRTRDHRCALEASLVSSIALCRVNPRQNEHARHASVAHHDNALTASISRIYIIGTMAT